VKKNISFSLFGTDLKYYIGAEKNIIINKELLPEWNTLIYYNSNNIIEGYYERLIELGAIMINVELFNIGDRNPNEYPYLWRFLTFFNEGIHIVRDLDSRISKREVEYIQRWEKNECKYFIIRDHPWQSPVPSGLFGVKGKDDEFYNYFESYLRNNDIVWGSDQDILFKYREKMTQNDIFYCGFDNNKNYIPRDDPNFFIGIQLNEKDEPIEPSATLALDFLKSLKL